MLDAGTNSGKTYFILKALLPWAYEHRKRILILCNREALRNQIERDAKRLGRIEVTYEDRDPVLGETVNKPAIDNKYEHTMKENDILCVFHYVPLHSAPAGLKFGRFDGVDENTTADSDRLVRLPMYYNIKNDDLNKVIEKTLEFFNSETK